jgi:hypothetical protein
LKTKLLFSECVGCGKIGNIALKSFRKHHPKLPITVYGTAKDFKELEVTDGMQLVDLNDSDWGKQVLTGYNEGHMGTAILWAYLVKNLDYDMFVHFDSDVVFRGDLMNDIFNICEDAELIGGRRQYSDNIQYTTGLVGLSDVVSTSSFAFSKRHISEYDMNTLTHMMRGIHNPLKHRTIDFFDPVSFDILKNGGRIKFLDWNDVGGCAVGGSRDNVWGQYNNGTTAFKIEFGNKIAHFSGVGSGMAFHNSPLIRGNVAKSYVDYCLDRYYLFMKIFYKEDNGFDLTKYQSLIDDKLWDL